MLEIQQSEDKLEIQKLQEELAPQVTPRNQAPTSGRIIKMKQRSPQSPAQNTSMQKFDISDLNMQSQMQNLKPDMEDLQEKLSLKQAENQDL